MTARKQHSSNTSAQKIADIASMDTHGIPLRKVADLLMVAAALRIIMQHATHAHGDHGPDWQAWVLLAIGGGDLGIQSIGAILKAYLRK